MTGLGFFKKTVRLGLRQGNPKRRDPAYQAALSEAARVFDQRDWARAAKLYENVVAFECAIAADWVQFGHALKEAGVFDDAEGAYTRASLIQPHNVDPYRQCGYLLKRLERHDDAAEQFLMGLSTSPEESDLRAELNTYGFQGMRLELALIAAALRVGEASPLELRTVLSRSDVMRHQSHVAAAGAAAAEKRWAEAARDYQSAMTLIPHRSDLLVQLGHALKEDHKLRAAEVAYRAAISWKPFDADAYLHLGHQQKLSGARDLSILFYTTAWRLHPGVPAVERELRDYAGWSGTMIKDLATQTWSVDPKPDAPPQDLVYSSPELGPPDDGSVSLSPPDLSLREMKIWADLTSALTGRM